MIQVGDYDEPTRSLSLSAPTLFKPEPSVQKHLLRESDVLFLSKGKRWLCFRPGPLNLPAVAADAFFVLSPGSELLPDFLVWVLNLRSSRNELSRDAGGSRNPIIRKDAIADFKIQVPPLARQQQLLHLEQMRRKEADILKRLLITRERFAQSLYTALSTQQDPTP
jgi:restriction endonuclease S subunit